MDFSKTDGLIFDLDGTLWDAAPACALAWNQTFTEHGGGFPPVNDDFVRSVSGLRVETVFQDYFHFIPAEAREVVLQRYKTNEALFMRRHGGTLYPGVREGLQRLSKKYKLFIVSNCQAGYIETFLELHQLQHGITDFECSGKTGKSKAENIAQLVTRNNLNAPVYIGDTQWDHEAATAAGVPFVFAEYGFGNVSADVPVIRSFTDLEQLF